MKEQTITSTPTPFIPQFSSLPLILRGLLEEEIKLAKVELESNDNERIVKATKKLSNESQAIFGKIYQQANPNGDPNAQGGANGGEEFHQ